MESSEAGPSTSTSFKDSNVGISNSGPGSVTTGPVNFNIYNIPSASVLDNFSLPEPITSFHGPEEEMRKLDEEFFTQLKITQNKNKVVICGLGGFGKSELAKQYAERCLKNKKVDHVVWIESEDPNKLKESFEKLKLNKYSDKQLIIIFDNCVTQKSIADYEPRGNPNHRVLITSQAGDWRRDVPIIELEPLSSEHALQVFRSVLGDNMYRVEDEHYYETLAHSVSYIPLGLQIVASYVEQGDEDFNLKEYVNEITKSEHYIINKPIPDCANNSYSNTIYGAMLTSINKINNKPDQERHIPELADDVLCFSAYLNPDCIKTEDLIELVNRKNSERTEKEVHLAITLLSKYSFLRYRNNNKSDLVQHRTTQAFVRYYISESKPRSEYYKVSLDWQCKKKGVYYPTILSHVDSNLTIVHDFYKDNYMHDGIGWFLIQLVRCEYIQSIKIICENPDEQTKKYILRCDLLADCAKTENVAILKILLSHVDINTKNVNQDTALHVLARQKNIKGIKFLVEHGADVNVTNAAGDPPLFTFIRGHQLNERHDRDEVFKTLQPNGDFSVTNSNNQTLLHAAVTIQQPEFIDFLIANGLQVNQTDNNGWTPLDSLYHHILKPCGISIRIYDYDYVPILEKLLKLGATLNINHTNNRGESCDYVLLNCAVFKNNLELLELLLNSGIIDVNSRSCEKQTVLHTCAIKKNLKATQIVIKHNADCYVIDLHGDTPLFYFAQYRREECSFTSPDDMYDMSTYRLKQYYYPDSNADDSVDMDIVKNMLDLLQCHPGHVDAAGDTVLHGALKYFNVKLVEMLVTVYKFDVNIQNSNGDTPLHALISSLKDILSDYDMYKKNIIQIIKMFNRYNARLDLENNRKETPMDKLQRLGTKKYSHIINDLSPYLTPAPSSVNNRKRKSDS